VGAQDLTVTGSAAVSVGYTLTVTDVNDAPTAVALTNKTTTLAENTSTTARIKVADILVTDDSIGTTTLSLTGSDAASFEILSSALYLKAGVTLNYEVKNSYAVGVSAQDLTLTDSRPVTASYTLAVTDVNEAPTAVALLDGYQASLPENLFFPSPYKVADIVVADDALSTNTLTLSGTDAASFTISGTSLYLKPEVPLDYEAKNSYAVTVAAQDPTVIGSTPVSVGYTLAITDVNEAPTALTLANTTASLAENTSTTARVKVADIILSDDALGTNMLSLTGTDAASFEIAGTGLYLKAGVALNYEAKNSYAVTVSGADATVPGSKPVSVAYILAVTDVNEAPTALTLANKMTSLAENTSTAVRIKVADIVLTDDALGMNKLTLSGTDATSFEVSGTSLYLKAGVALNSEAKNSYAVTVIGQDATLTGSTPVTTAYTLAVSDVNEAPTGLTLTNTTAALAENTSTTTRIKVADIVVADDALGSNTLTLTGADTASFEISGTGLYLKAGVGLNYESQTTYAVTVSAVDTSLPGSIPLTTNYSLTVTDINEAPTFVALTNRTPVLAENTSTTARIKAADFTVLDDALGSNSLSLGGADSASFEIVGTALYLKAGVTLNFEVKSSYLVTLNAADSTVIGSLPATAVYTLGVTDVNEAPTALALANQATTLAENTAAPSRIKVADLVISDDKLGTNTLSLTGSDAASFEIVGSVLYLKAGVTLNYEAKTSYAVTVGLQDTTVTGSTALTAAFTLLLTDINEAPTGTAFANQTQSLAENTSTAVRIKVADIGVTDDFLGTNSLSLSGTDAGSFEISGTTLFLKAGVALNYEARGILSVIVSAADATLTGSTPATGAFTLLVTDVNEAPTSLTLANKTTSLAENTSTTARIKVADIAVTDDALGTNTLTLSGADAASFEITGTVLYLKAGVTLNYEAKNSHAVTVSAQDTTLTGSTPLTVAYTLLLTDVNEAPTAVTLTNTTTSLTENTSTATRIKVADIVVANDALGTNTLALSGTDAASFEISGTTLYLKAGVALNYEVKNSYAVTVSGQDATLTGSTPVTAAYALAVTDVNESPTALALANKTMSLAENTSTTARIKLTDIVVTDDALGTNTLTLSGTDAASFEISGTVLYLKAGVPLNYEAKNSYAVTVTLQDTTLVGSTALPAAYTLLLTDVNEAPTALTLANKTTGLPENTSTTARIKLADIVVTDDALGTNTLSLTGADAASFEIISNALYLKAGVILNFEARNSYTVTINAADATITGSQPATTGFGLSLTNVNETPTITSSAAVSVAENTTSAGSVTGTDPDAGTTLAYSLVGGVDAAQFSIDSVTGALSFLKAPNFELPTDDGANTIYNLTVQVSDGTLKATQNLAITVTDVAEIPSVAINPTTATVKKGGTVLYTFTLSEPSTTFTAGDVYPIGGTVSGFTKTGTMTYTALFTPEDNATKSGYVVVYDNTFTNAAGTGNRSPNGYVISFVTIDTAAPTLTITSDRKTLSKGQTAAYTFTLSEPTTSFTEADVFAVNGAISNFTAVSSTIYTATLTPQVGFNGTGYVVVYDNAFYDAFGNGNTSTGGAVINAVSIDTVSPSITVKPDKTMVKKGETVLYTFTLSEASTTFAAGDVYPINGIVSSFTTLSSTLYTCVFTPTANLTGTGYVVVYDNTFSDTAGNGNVSTGGYVLTSVSIDTTPPTVSIAADRQAAKKGDAVNITITLSEASPNLTASSLQVTNGTLAPLTKVTATTYTTVFNPAVNVTGTGSIRVLDNAFTDTFGNGNTASNLISVSLDTAPPTVTITSDKTALKAGETATFTFKLSKPSTTFAAADVFPNNGTVNSFKAIDSTTYSTVFTPTANFTGNGTVVVYDNTFTDLVGNGNASSGGAVIASLPVDTLPPTVTITTDRTLLKSGETALFTITLSEASTTFTQASITPSGGKLSAFTQLSSTQYRVLFTPTAKTTTTGSVSVKNSVFTDLIGNRNTGPGTSTSKTISIDTKNARKPTDRF
jgi:hypothetical protein